MALSSGHADLPIIPFVVSLSLFLVSPDRGTAAATAQPRHLYNPAASSRVISGSQPRRDDARTACPTVSAELNFTLPRLRLFMPHLACTQVLVVAGGTTFRASESLLAAYRSPAACPAKRSRATAVEDSSLGRKERGVLSAETVQGTGFR